MARTQVPIVRVEAAGVPYKNPRGGYLFPTRLVLEDGRVLAGHEGRRLLREAKAAVAELPREPKNMSAVFNDAGEFVATCTSYSLI